MNKIICKLAIISKALLLLLIISLSCKGKDIYVAVNGNDHNVGTKEKPFASIPRAQVEVRKINSSVTVYLRGGTYYLTSPIIFTPNDSREKGMEVVYKAYPKEKVIISSAVVLKQQWQDYKGAIKQTTINNHILFDQLFIDGHLQRMARYPNYNPLIAHYGGFAADAIDPKRVKGWQSPAGGYVHALHQSQWGDMSYLITGKDTAGHLKMEGGYQNNRPSPMHKTYRYVENIFEELDTAAEWYFDKTRHILYVYPSKGVNLNKSTLQLPQLESLIEFKGTELQPVKNITIEGVELTQTLRTFMKNKEPLLRGDWTLYRKGAVTMEGAEHCYIKECFFNAVGGNAMVFSNYNKENEISGCHIAAAGGSGVVLVGDPNAVRSPLFRYEQANDPNNIDRIPRPKTNNFPIDCVVKDNLIEDIGQVEKQVAGVEISMAMNVTVSHNTIDNVPRAGINVNDGNWGGHNIEYNDVFNTVLETGDHGAFNSWGRDRFWFPDRRMMDSIVNVHPDLIMLDMSRPMVIHDNRFRCDHGWDIDLDNGSSNYIICNNVCLNGGLKLREGFHRKVYNNILINNSFHPHAWFKNSEDIFTHNIVASAYFPIGIKYWGKEIDNNVFPDAAALADVQKYGIDKNSLAGNPMFTDPSKGDYTVRKGSPALEAGFKNFPMNEFGVTSPALKAIAHKVGIPLIGPGAKNSKPELYKFLGVDIKSLKTLGEPSATGMAAEAGVLIIDVPKASMLYDKIYANDVILKFNTTAVKDVNDLLRAKSVSLPNQPVMLTIFRNQAVKTVKLLLK